MVVLLFGVQDFSPPLVVRVLFGLYFLPLFLQAARGGDKLPLEPLLIQRVFGDDEIFLAQTHLLF